MDAIGAVSFVFFVVAGVSAQVNPASDGNANSNGRTNNGTVNLGNLVLVGYTNNNDLFQALSSSQNSAGGSGTSISGSSSSGAHSASSDFDLNSAYILASSGANSNGNALTGTLNDLDQSNTSPVGGINGQGSSQITGSGTRVNISSHANGNAYAQPTSTTGPNFGCCYEGDCYHAPLGYVCSCPCGCCYPNGVISYSTPGSGGQAAVATPGSNSATQAGRNGKSKSLQKVNDKNNVRPKPVLKSQVRQRQLAQETGKQKKATGKQAASVQKQRYSNPV